MLQQYKEGHHELANLLMEREVIFAEDAEHIFGKRPWASRSEEILEPIEKELQEEKRPKAGKKTRKAMTAEQTEPTLPTAGETEQSETPEPAEKTAEPATSAAPAEKAEPTVTEAPDYSQDDKPKAERPRKRKEGGLFGGFNFEQDNQDDQQA
jgi:hypothetical protein